ncbi:MAG: PKD domain-containing protein [Phycisphaerae bacterium]|nr:PKD domain-containing protein [Phycisphaerae bacterium]
MLRSVGLGCSGCLLLATAVGCTNLPKDEAGVRFLKEVEPETGATYYLAIPTEHTSTKRWSLIVTCHGTPPWDTAIQQIGRWGTIASEKKVVVVAPVLKGTASDQLFPSVDRQIANQERDERVILAVVDRIKPGYNIDPSRVFLTGWSGGGYAVLYTGLRHPEVFRALAVHQGNFDERFVESARPRLDPYQPVQISWGITDLLKENAENSLAWLRKQRMAYAIPQELSGTHRLLPEVAYSFFQRCVREYPWIVVTASASRADELMAIRFRVRSSPPARAYFWQFGDEAISRDPDPEHIYSQPGTYEVQATVETKDGRQYVRKVRVTVPVARIGVAAGG